MKKFRQSRPFSTVKKAPQQKSPSPTRKFMGGLFSKFKSKKPAIEIKIIQPLTDPSFFKRKRNSDQVKCDDDVLTNQALGESSRGRPSITERRRSTKHNETESSFEQTSSRDQVKNDRESSRGRPTFSERRRSTKHNQTEIRKRASVAKGKEGVVVEFDELELYGQILHHPTRDRPKYKGRRNPSPRRRELSTQSANQLEISEKLGMNFSDCAVYTTPLEHPTKERPKYIGRRKPQRQVKSSSKQKVSKVSRDMHEVCDDDDDDDDDDDESSVDYELCLKPSEIKPQRKRSSTGASRQSSSHGTFVSMETLIDEDGALVAVSAVQGDGDTYQAFDDDDDHDDEEFDWDKRCITPKILDTKYNTSNVDLKKKDSPRLQKQKDGLDVEELVDVKREEHKPTKKEKSKVVSRESKADKIKFTISETDEELDADILSLRPSMIGMQYKCTSSKARLQCSSQSALPGKETLSDCGESSDEGEETTDAAPTRKQKQKERTDRKSDGPRGKTSQIRDKSKIKDKDEGDDIRESKRVASLKENNNLKKEKKDPDDNFDDSSLVGDDADVDINLIGIRPSNFASKYKKSSNSLACGSSSAGKEVNERAGEKQSTKGKDRRQSRRKGRDAQPTVTADVMKDGHRSRRERKAQILTTHDEDLDTMYVSASTIALQLQQTSRTQGDKSLKLESSKIHVVF